MEQTQASEFNRARVSGRLRKLRKRWTPDGSLSLIAELVTTRPQLGPVRAGVQDQQPMPLRATGEICHIISGFEEQHVIVEGCLRRRFYSRDGEPCWGQVEIWVDSCRLAEQTVESPVQTREEI